MFLDEVKLNVQPIYINFEVGNFPGDYIKTQTVPKEIYEKTIAEKTAVFNQLKGINLLKPIVVESEKEVMALSGKMSRDIDFILTTVAGPRGIGGKYGGHRHIMSTELLISDTLKLPLIMLATDIWDCFCMETSGAIRERGGKAYFAPTIEQMNKFLKIQQVKKAMAKSKILNFNNVNRYTTPLDRNTHVTSPYDPRMIKEMTGIDVEYYPISTLAEDVKGISDAQGKKAADAYFKGATSVKTLYTPDEHDEKYRVNFGKLDTAIRNAIKNKGATAMAGCCDLATAPIYAPACLTLTWLKDEGIPSFCEADLGTGIPMIMLHFLANEPADMGNVCINAVGVKNMMEFEVPNPDKNTLTVNHCVTPRKLKGYDKPADTYEIIGGFLPAYYGNIGAGGITHVAHIQTGVTVTLARISANANKMLLAKGTLKKSGFTPATGNRQISYIDIGMDTNVFWEKFQSNFGNHLCFVYGDHVEEMAGLCKELGIEPMIANA